MSGDFAVRETRSLLILLKRSGVVYNPIEEINKPQGKGKFAIRWSRLGLEWLMIVQVLKFGKLKGLYRVYDARKGILLVDTEFDLQKPPFATLHKGMQKSGIGFRPCRTLLRKHAVSFARGYLLLARYLISSASDEDLRTELKYFQRPVRVVSLTASQS